MHQQNLFQYVNQMFKTLVCTYQNIPNQLLLTYTLQKQISLFKLISGMH